MRGVFIVCCLITVLSGCASSSFERAGSNTLPPYAGEVALLEGLPAPGSYQLIGVVIVRGVRLTSDKRMYQQLKELAAERGANAVVPQSAIKNRATSDGGEERRLAGYAIIQ